MGQRSENRHATSDGSDDALQRALQQRSAQRITDLRERPPLASGTERISRMLAEARQERDDAANPPEEPQPDRPRRARLPFQVPPSGRDRAQTESSSTDAG